MSEFKKILFATDFSMGSEKAFSCALSLAKKYGARLNVVHVVQEMLDMTEKDRIRRAVLVEGRSIRNVAEETGHSRNTISKMLADSDIPSYTLTGERPCPVLGPYKDRIDRWVEKDERKPKKKRRTAKRMYNILREKYDYGFGNNLRAFGEAAARGLTFGGSDYLMDALGADMTDIRMRQALNSQLSLAGEITGAVLPAVLTLGGSTTASGAKFAAGRLLGNTPAGLAMRLGTATSKAAGVGSSSLAKRMFARAEKLGVSGNYIEFTN